jgi:serine/threonine-protein kinase
MEIAQALDVAHTAGVVHRDLKPANVFLCKRAGRDDFVKVLDFGVSKLIDSATLTQEKAMVGTPLYMSPEQAVGTQELTPESDIFSLGAISFEMLTGRRAFAASSIPSILYQIVHGATPKLAGRAPGLSSAVDEVFGRVLAKKKVERYKRASHFSAELAQALSRTSQVDALQKLTFDAEDILPSIEAQLVEPTGPKALATGADDTEVESSTGEQALVTGGDGAAKQTAAGKLATARPPSELQDYARHLRGKSRRAPFIVVGVLGVATVAAVLLLRASNKPHVTPPAPVERVPLEATVQDPPPPTPPTVAQKGDDEELAVPEDKQPTFEPDPVRKHDDVQFIFHVWPHGAEITVDDKRVESGKLTLHYQKAGHRVVVRANGYHTLSLSAPSTANRTFELRLDRALQPAKKPEHKKPAHDAAPVQDL